MAPGQVWDNDIDGDGLPAFNYESHSKYEMMVHVRLIVGGCTDANFIENWILR